MINLNNEIKQRKLPAKILLQIHDELLLEVKKEAAQEVSLLTRQIMESVIQLSLPLNVDINHAKNWAEI